MFALLAVSCWAEACIPGRIKVQITNVEFEAAPGLTLALKNEIRKVIEAHVHDYCQLSDEMAEHARDILQQHGYLKALVHDPIWKQIGGTYRDQLIRVLLACELGQRYRLKSIAFRGQTTFTTDKLRAAIPMMDGEIFNVERMRIGLKNLLNLYRSNGYLNVVPVPNTEIHDENQQIIVLFDIDEGKQLLVGKLVLNGKEPYAGAGKDLLTAWAKIEGHVCSGKEWIHLYDEIDSLKAVGRPVNQLLSILADDRFAAVLADSDAGKVDFFLRFPDE